MIAAMQRTSPEIVEWYTSDSRLSWVDCDDVARVASKVLSKPEAYIGKAIPLAYDVASVPEVVNILEKILGPKIYFQDEDPSVFLEMFSKPAPNQSICIAWKMF